MVLCALSSLCIMHLSEEERELALRLENFSMLNSAEHEIYPAHKCQNANNCWHFNIY